jgi:hypothetical protein
MMRAYERLDADSTESAGRLIAYPKEQFLYGYRRCFVLFRAKDELPWRADTDSSLQRTQEGWNGPYRRRSDEALAAQNRVETRRIMAYGLPYIIHECVIRSRETRTQDSWNTFCLWIPVSQGA